MDFFIFSRLLIVLQIYAISAEYANVKGKHRCRLCGKCSLVLFPFLTLFNRSSELKYGKRASYELRTSFTATLIATSIFRIMLPFERVKVSTPNKCASLQTIEKITKYRLSRDTYECQNDCSLLAHQQFQYFASIGDRGKKKNS